MNLFTKKQEGQAPRRLGCLGKTLVGIGIYFLVCAIIGWMMGDAFSTPATVIEENTIYRIDMSGVVVEQAAEADPWSGVMAELSGKNMESE